MSKYVFMWFALWPVFTSCSPTYALILSIILPAGIAFGMLALISYTLWLAVILFAIALFGQKLVKKLAWASNPNWAFKKILGVIFILVGLTIYTWYDKKIEAAMLDAGFLNTTIFEQWIIDRLELDEIDEETSTSTNSLSAKKKLLDDKSQWSICSDGSCEKSVDWSLTFLSPKNIIEDSSESLLIQAWFKAPDFSGLTSWVNSGGYDSISELEWKVVMIDFWTLGCINCINTHKETNKLYDEFKNQWFELIGLHAPEFAYERKIENVIDAVNRFEIEFPVALDNDFETWNRYNNRYWPAFYIIWKNWDIRYTHFWEGWYEEKREAIIKLLAEKN